MSQPKTKRPVLFYLVRWYIDRTVKATAARIIIQGSALSTYVSYILYVRIRLSNFQFIISMSAFACGFHGEAGLVLIAYFCSIKLLWTCDWGVLLLGHTWFLHHGYCTSQVVSTTFEIVIAFLLLYWVISNHSVTGSIIVTAFRIKGYFPFLHIL